jgi:hypothetical protein
MGSSMQPIFVFCTNAEVEVASHLVRQKLWERRVPVDTEHAWLFTRSLRRFRGSIGAQRFLIKTEILQRSSFLGLLR